MLNIGSDTIEIVHLPTYLPKLHYVFSYSYVISYHLQDSNKIEMHFVSGQPKFYIHSLYILTFCLLLLIVFVLFLTF